MLLKGRGIKTKNLSDKEERIGETMLVLFGCSGTGWEKNKEQKHKSNKLW